MTTETKNMIKVRATDAAPFGGENMWAEQVGKNSARLANVPFFAYDLNLDDVVEFDSDHNIVCVTTRSGLCTLRVVLNDGEDDHARSAMLNDIARQAKENGAEGSEGGFGILLAINVTSANFRRVCFWLETLRADGKIREWEMGSVPSDNKENSE